MKTALITGASRGIGAAAAWALAREGFAVALGFLNSGQAGAALLQELRAAGHTAALYRADVADPQAVAQMVADAAAELGSIRVLVNNAGVAEYGLLTELTNQRWRRLWEVNVSGALYCAQAVLPAMVARGEGSIVNISSIWGVSGASCEVAYSATKSALIGFTRALAKEVGPSGVRVNAVAPGVIETDMNAQLSPGALAELREQVPLGRLGSPEEVARAIAWLAGAQSSFVTGQVLTVDGGIL